jgi:tetratricopeptide (TPR) repeat protein
LTIYERPLGAIVQHVVAGDDARCVSVFLPSLSSVRVEKVVDAGGSLSISARTGTTQAICPQCTTVCIRIHARHERRLRDGVLGGQPVVIHLVVQRFICANTDCETRTFTEQVPGLTLPYRRRSLALLGVLGHIAVALAGRAGARLAGLLGIIVHPSTPCIEVGRRPLPRPRPRTTPATGVPAVPGRAEYRPLVRAPPAAGRTPPASRRTRLLEDRDKRSRRPETSPRPPAPVTPVASAPPSAPRVVESDADTTALLLAAELRDWADRVGIDKVGDRLRQRMTEAYQPERRRVYRAVAAFGTPVDAETVAALVDEGREPDEQLGTEGVRRELIRLSRHAICTDRGERVFFMMSDEARRVLDWRVEASQGDLQKAKACRQLLESAAEVLRRRRKADRHRDWEDSQASFAEVDVWLRADLPEGALRSIDEMDSHAETGSPAMLFRQPRQLIAPRIPPTDQPANYAVLGYLYHASGDFTRAKDAYRFALAGIPDERPNWKAKVLVDFAGLEWALESPEHAFVDFERARKLAPRIRQ